MIESMRDTLLQESAAVAQLAARLDEKFEHAARMLLECKGRVIACGIGKAGDIAKKFSSTLSSTGTPSAFLHAAEAVHGDLGMVTGSDVVVFFSNSGETEEILRVYPSLREIGAATILVTGRPLSTAAAMSDLVLDIGIEREACPHNLAPTTSTTLMLALSDALALAVMGARNFGKQEYAVYHPSGALGRRLLIKVEDAMRSGDDVPLVAPETSFMDVLQEITRAKAGAACVVGAGGELLGLIADGDIRRHLVNEGVEVLKAHASEVMTPNPLTVSPKIPAVEALELFESLPQKVGELPVVQDGRVVGLVMLKDLVRLGLV
jgi:arabinose-5-phosphate isomerase